MRIIINPHGEAWPEPPKPLIMTHPRLRGLLVTLPDAMPQPHVIEAMKPQSGPEGAGGVV